jgi:hypothetical protein
MSAAVVNRIIDDLERRMERRLRKLRDLEDAFVAQNRAGSIDPRTRASYQSEGLRYNDARLAYNAALRIAKEAGL